MRISAIIECVGCCQEAQTTVDLGAAVFGSARLVTIRSVEEPQGWSAADDGMLCGECCARKEEERDRW